MPSIQSAYNWAIATCNADNVGYSQAYRNQRTVNGITYYDCSSFIWYALQDGGFDVVKSNGGSTWPFTTSNMATALKILGFTKRSVVQPWTPGDILIRSGHTEMAFDYNHTMGAHSSKVALDQQVSINANPSSASDWTELWRYGEGANAEWISGNRYLSTTEMQTNAYLIFTYLLSRGWSVAAVSGLLGNMQKESTINPGIWQNLTPDVNLGWGLVQWSPSTKYTDWAAANGYADDDGTWQLYWIDQETVSQGQWVQSSEYPMTFAEFKMSTDTPENLAYAFMYNFEQPASKDQPDRQVYARYWYDWWVGSPVPPPNPKPEPEWTAGLPTWMMLRKF